jgi:hypothetical protein
MGEDKSPDYGGRPPMSPRRALALVIYILVLAVLVKLYWPGWPYPNTPSPPPTAPASGTTQVPQN